MDRNVDIVRKGLALAAFPRTTSRGTWGAVREARRLRRPCVVVDESGRVV